MQNFLLGIVNEYGYVGIGLLIFLENIFPPIPSEVILLFSGFLIISTELELGMAVAAATIGSTLGAMALYYIGVVLGKENIKKLAGSRVGSFCGLEPENIDNAIVWFDKYGYKAVFVCRCIPVLRSLISIPAGISSMKFVPFLIFTIAGSLVWNTVLVFLGTVTGAAWESCVEYFGVYSFVAAIAILFAILVFLIMQRKKNKR